MVDSRMMNNFIINIRIRRTFYRNKVHMYLSFILSFYFYFCQLMEDFDIGRINQVWDLIILICKIVSEQPSCTANIVSMF